MPAKKPTGVLMERNHDRSEKQFICCSDKNQSEWKFKKFDFFHNCMGYFFGIMRGENRLGEKLGKMRARCQLECIGNPYINTNCGN